MSTVDGSGIRSRASRRGVSQRERRRVGALLEVVEGSKKKDEQIDVTTEFASAPSTKVKKSRRPKGEGSIFTRADGRFRGYITYQDPTGKRMKRYASGGSEEEVRTKLEATKNQLGPVFKRGPVPKWTFEAYAWEWLRYHSENIKPHTVETYERELRLLVLPYIGMIPLTEVTAKHIREMQSAILKTGKGDNAKRSRKSANRVLQAAYLEGLIARNPAAGVKGIKHKPKRKEIWTAAQALTFLKAAEGHPLYALFYLALFTGLRPGELYALEWDCVFDTELLVRKGLSRAFNKLTEEEPKTDAGHRYVPLSSDAKAVLDAYAPKKRKGLVFPNEIGKPLNPSNVRHRMFQPLLEKAGLKSTEQYTLRHTYASMHIAAGTDAAKLAKWMGHTNGGFTMSYYVQAFDRADQKAALGYAELLGLSSTATGGASTGVVNSGGTTLRITLSLAQREALLRGEPLTLELGAG